MCLREKNVTLRKNGANQIEEVQTEIKKHLYFIQKDEVSQLRKLYINFPDAILRRDRKSVLILKLPTRIKYLPMFAGDIPPMLTKFWARLA